MSGADVKTKQNTTDAIKSQLRNGSMTYSVRDAQGRMIEFYETHIFAVAGTPTLLTRFKYEDGPLGNSRDVLATKETIVEWSALYDFEALP